MTTRRTLAWPDMALGAAIATSAALAMGLAAAWISTPAHFNARVEALAAQSKQTRALLPVSTADSPFPPDALCHRDAAAEASILRDSLSASAAQANLSLDFLEAHPESGGGDPVGLAPIRLKFAVTGSYENVIGLLASLARQRPEIFADGVDLTAKTANVTASFSGRAFCAA